ncbi:Dihydroflavonol-4-reductase [Dactylella cylindrospora]|nr:Dihydroflavonol-4-reductase [Dactylella cylindrospora]
MTTPPKGGLILVTGVTGYIASWTALYLLERGYRVRGTARTLSKAEYLKSGPYAKYADNFEIVRVADLEDDGAFNEAVKGVDGIAHIASPFHYKVTDPYKDLINPAVNGTLNLLNAAKDYAGPQLKRVVVTSSFAAIMEPKPPGSDYTEEQWNQFSVTLCETKPASEIAPHEAYRASKTLAERALWKFNEEQKPSFSIAAINPVFVFGPVIHQVKDAESINTSVFLLFQYLAGQKTEVADQTPVQAYVDVRNVADAHVSALEVEEAKNQRFLNVADNFSWDQVVEILRKHYPERVDKIPAPTGKTVVTSKLINTKSKEVLGVEYIPFEDCVVATAKSVEQFL